MDLQQLTKIAIKAALAAGKVIRNAMDQEVAVEKKVGGDGYASQVVTAVDRACEKVIFSHLKLTCTAFDIALLSEETEDDESRFQKEYFWCIDPMDGTLAFINKYQGFSVSIALVAKDGTPHIGVVYDPSKDHLYYAIKGKGAFKNGEKWEVTATNNYVTYVTDKKLDDTPNKAQIKEILQHKVNTLKAEELKEISGSGAVLNAILVAENAPAIFLKLPKKEKGGGSIWDFAATACIFQELKLKATGFDGDSLNLNNKKNTFMNAQGVFYSSLTKGLKH